MNSNSQGIPIEDALSILSLRKPHHHADCNSIGDRAKHMGQTIDLLETTTTTAERGNEEIRIRDEERHKKVQNELNEMPESELLQAVLRVQEDRVKTYKNYETDLGTVLHTGNMTGYPDACLSATASFSVLSETVNAIQSVLEQREQKELVGLLKQLQGYEKDKLHITAAHHLERIRKRNEEMQPNCDPRNMKLLEDGVASLQHKINATVDNINETIDEIRCMLLDLDDQ
ncbi:unnamed protein product [Cylindrotheca closterium]|uniref:Uncharacterized protein n=1 Tax=Cylindrotheca closterium TaxID=2856 RepID=A0AAD2CNB5_9STRA|nr:unnamed protein product [Cylindrotheca closterium]